MKRILRRIGDFKTKLILTFSLIIIIPALLIGSLAYFSAKEAIKHEMMAGFNENLKLLNSTIDNVIQAKIHDVEYLSEIVASNEGNAENSLELRKTYDQYIQLHPEAQAIYLGSDTGVFIREPNIQMPSDYDPRERGWYKGAMEQEGEIIISDPYISASTKDMVITISKTTKDHSGVIGIDVSLSYLQKITNQVQIGHDGYASIIDENYKYIAHPTEKNGSEVQIDFKNSLSGNKTGQFTYEFEEETYEFTFVTNELTGWKLTGTVVSKEISNAASPIFKSTVLIIILSVIIGAVAIFCFLAI